MTKRKLYFNLPFLLFLIIGTIYITYQQKSTTYQKSEGKIFGTFYHITYQHNKKLDKEILDELNKVDMALSMFNKESIISRINRNEDVQTDSMFETVYSLAQNVSEETDGAFDITVAPLVNAWGFGFKTGNPPTRQSINSLRAIVGYGKVSLKGHKIVKKDPRVMLDCSAIAKGYGCDVVAAMLRRKGVENYMVEIGGEVVAHGISEKRLPWKIGVTKPTDDSINVNTEIQAVLNVKDMAMATSGNYRNFYYKNGKKYAHTIDPATGMPVQHSILSATVLTRTCAEADAYATSFMVMGMEKAQKVLEEKPELMAYLIYTDKDGKLCTWHSKSMEGKILDKEMKKPTVGKH